MPDSGIVVLDLVAVISSDRPDEESNDEKGAWRQQHQSVGLVNRLGEDRDAKQLSGTKQLPEKSNYQENHAVTQPIPDAVDKAIFNGVLHRKAFSSAHDDAVRNNQADKDGKFFTQTISDGLQYLINDDYQAGDDRHLNNDPDTVGDLVANQGD